MLQSARFTKVVTHDTHQRLLRAEDNSQPISRGEAHRGAVVALQSGLSSLNSAYLVGAEIDGYFGSRTARAVEAFQRDYGLVADGIVGRQTLTQLDVLYAQDIMRAPRALSIHIGVDRVDAGHYGSEMKLPSCENDARAMAEIAAAIGYDTLVMVNEEATTRDFIGFVRSCAANLFAEDCLLITFSGHGSQVPNTSADYEPDLLDETSCFFDRMLIDDELYGLLAELRGGVRVHVVLDSCHSGTALKEIQGDGEHMRKRYAESVAKGIVDMPYVTTTGLVGISEDELVPFDRASLDKALDGDERPTQISPPAPNPAQAEEVGTLFADLLAESYFGPVKFIDGTQVYSKNRLIYDTVEDVVGSKGEGQLECTVAAVSAAMDTQTTPAGNPLSLFTFNITQVWNNGSFRGSYQQFLRALLDRSPQNSTPQLTTYGSGGSEARVHERPFMF